MENVEARDHMHYEGTCIRPPPEADSILLQVTLGCSHNQCTFCGTYKDKRFAIKDDRIILGNILYASRHMPYRDRVFLLELLKMLVHTELSSGVFTSTHPSNYLSFSARLPKEKQYGLYKVGEICSYKKRSYYAEVF